MTERTKRGWIERALETCMFQSRWLMAPIYLGLILTLPMLLGLFVRDLLELLPKLLLPTPEEIILGVLTLIELSLVANLVIIMVFSGYENFVSKIDTGDSEDRPSWMGHLDFSGLKMKLIGSIVAISIITLLRAFMVASQANGPIDTLRLRWLLLLHLSFLVSGCLFAAMDWVACRANVTVPGKDR